MLEVDTSPNMLNVLVLVALSISVRPISQESTPGPDAIASHTSSGVASTVISSRPVGVTVSQAGRLESPHAAGSPGNYRRANVMTSP